MADIPSITFIASPSNGAEGSGDCDYLTGYLSFAAVMISSTFASLVSHFASPVSPPPARFILQSKGDINGQLMEKQKTADEKIKELEVRPSEGGTVYPPPPSHKKITFSTCTF